MKAIKTSLATFIFLHGLGILGNSNFLISNAFADDEGIVIEDEGDLDSSPISEESVEDDSESYPVSDSDE